MASELFDRYNLHKYLVVFRGGEDIKFDILGHHLNEVDGRYYNGLVEGW